MFLFIVIIANTVLSVPAMLFLRRENDKIVTLQGHGGCGPKSEQRRYRLIKHFRSILNVKNDKLDCWHIVY